MRLSCALLMPSTEDEIARIRHSGVMNPNIFKLDKLLTEFNFLELSQDIPADLIDVLVLHLEGKARERANADAEAKKLLEDRERLLKSIEGHKDLGEKSRCAARHMAEKCDAQDQEQRQLLKREQEVRLNIARATQDERRKCERLTLDEKKLDIEHDRLRSLAKK
jgi:hypothetical protein